MRNARRQTSALLVLALFGCGCGADEAVTPDALRAAEARWKRAGPRSYNLEWIARGARAGHHLVYVRDGRVVQARAVEPDGRERLIDPDQAGAYGVEGLFGIIAADMERARSADVAGAGMSLTFDPDPSLGYPRRYRRRAAGAPGDLTLDVVWFDPTPPATVPPLPAPPDP